MCYYEPITICENKHIVAVSEEYTSKCCELCGSKVYTVCPHCGTPIRGPKRYNKVVSPYSLAYYTIPSYCRVCLEPYPWVDKLFNEVVELLALDIDLDNQSKDLIKTAIPGLIVEDMYTPIAAEKYKKGIAKAKEPLVNLLKSLLIDMVCETAKKIIFPN